jgi:putative ABC transport system permease protein
MWSAPALDLSSNANAQSPVLGTGVSEANRRLPHGRLRTRHKAIVGKVLSMLAALGLGLASLGVYGVIARTVAQRTGEFGIRLALGARPGDITRLVLTSGAKLAMIGSALGLLGAFGVSRLIAAAFPAMQMSIVPALLFATVLLIAIAQLACYMPARHASRISPTEALRAE